MSDLISRNEAWKAFDKWQLFVDREDRDIAQEVIENLPAVEAKPVVYGEWHDEIGDIHSTGKFVYCSICGNATFIPSKKILSSTTNDRHFKEPNFCPNCGADMRKEVE